MHDGSISDWNSRLHASAMPVSAIHDTAVRNTNISIKI